MTKVKVKTRRERRKRRYGTGQGNKERMNKDKIMDRGEGNPISNGKPIILYRFHLLEKYI